MQRRRMLGQAGVVTGHSPTASPSTAGNGAEAERRHPRTTSSSASSACASTDAACAGCAELHRTPRAAADVGRGGQGTGIGGGAERQW